MSFKLPINRSFKSCFGDLRTLAIQPPHIISQESTKKLIAVDFDKNLKCLSKFSLPGGIRTKHPSYNLYFQIQKCVFASKESACVGMGRRYTGMGGGYGTGNLYFWYFLLTKSTVLVNQKHPWKKKQTQASIHSEGYSCNWIDFTALDGGNVAVLCTESKREKNGGEGTRSLRIIQPMQGTSYETRSRPKVELVRIVKNLQGRLSFRYSSWGHWYNKMFIHMKGKILLESTFKGKGDSTHDEDTAIPLRPPVQPQIRRKLGFGTRTDSRNSIACLNSSGTRIRALREQPQFMNEEKLEDVNFEKFLKVDDSSIAAVYSFRRAKPDKELHLRVIIWHYREEDEQFHLTDEVELSFRRLGPTERVFRRRGDLLLFECVDWKLLAITFQDTTTEAGVDVSDLRLNNETMTYSVFDIKSRKWTLQNKVLRNSLFRRKYPHSENEAVRSRLEFYPPNLLFTEGSSSKKGSTASSKVRGMGYICAEQLRIHGENLAFEKHTKRCRNFLVFLLWLASETPMSEDVVKYCVFPFLWHFSISRVFENDEFASLRTTAKKMYIQTKASPKRVKKKVGGGSKKKMKKGVKKKRKGKRKKNRR